MTRLGTLLIGRGGRRFYSEGAGPVFGRADRNATAAFQRAQGWTGSAADGFPGPTTWNLLVTGRGRDIPRASVQLRSPLPGFRVTFAFGIKDDRYQAGRHTGADYAAPTGTPILAVVGGTVQRVADQGPRKGYGRYTIIRGDDGHAWLYAHQSRQHVRVGQRVRAGQLIGLVGSRGNTSGPHLHIEKARTKFWAYNDVVDPTF